VGGSTVALLLLLCRLLLLTTVRQACAAEAAEAAEAASLAAHPLSPSAALQHAAASAAESRQLSDERFDLSTPREASRESCLPSEGDAPLAASHSTLLSPCAPPSSPPPSKWRLLSASAQRWLPPSPGVLLTSPTRDRWRQCVESFLLPSGCLTHTTDGAFDIAAWDLRLHRKQMTKRQHADAAMTAASSGPANSPPTPDLRSAEAAPTARPDNGAKGAGDGAKGAGDGGTGEGGKDGDIEPPPHEQHRSDGR